VLTIFHCVQEYVPFGNAYYAIKACAKYQYPDTRFCWANATFAGEPGVFDGPLICQHGAGECSANLMEMCVIKYNPDWQKYSKSPPRFRGGRPILARRPPPLLVRPGEVSDWFAFRACAAPFLQCYEAAIGGSHGFAISALSPLYFVCVCVSVCSCSLVFLDSVPGGAAGNFTSNQEISRSHFLF